LHWYRFMTTRPDLSTVEIAELTAQAPPALAALLLTLLEIVAQQEQLLAEQVQTIAQLNARIRELEDQLNRSSHNSHQPPASDGFKKTPRSLRTRSGKPSGGQRGHSGHTLRMTDQPDMVVLHRPSHCQGCGISLAALPAHSQQRRQVVDLPPLRLLYAEHQVESVSCPGCGRLTSADFPPEAAEPIQYGPQVKALVVLLRSYQLLPSARTQELLADLFGMAPSEGTLDTIINTAAADLSEVVAQIQQGVVAAPVAHFDETGCYVEDKRYWLHVAATATLTYYCVHRKRGQQGSTAAGVLPEFAGIAVHDAYAPYWRYGCEHALCNAHLLRELLFVAERGEQSWAEQLATLLREMLAASEQARAEQAAAVPSEQVAEYERRYRELLTAGLAANPVLERPAGQQRGRVKQSVATNLLLRLRDHAVEVLRFIHDLRVPFDNNQAERDLRMMKVQQKIAGRFRTVAGAEAFCRIRSYISTLRKQGLHVFTALQQLFRGVPVQPATAG
jgi:transposase